MIPACRMPPPKTFRTLLACLIKSLEPNKREPTGAPNPFERQIEILSNNLYNTVKDTYSIEAVSKQRRELYLSLLDEKKNNNVQRVSESDTVRI